MYTVLPKEIQMEFYRIEKKELLFLYNNLEVDDLYRLLRRINDQDLIERLTQEMRMPNLSQTFLQCIKEHRIPDLKKYLKGKQPFEILTKQTIQQLQQDEDEEIIIVQDSKLLDLSLHTLLHVLEFLNPMELNRTRLICQKFDVIFREPSLSARFYKKFCQALFTFEHTLPIVSPYEQITEFVNHNIELYPNEVVEAVNTNIRQVVLGEYQLNNVQYEELLKQYGSPQQMYEKCPRLNYCGIYAVKESYLKRGEAGMSQAYAPCHIVEFYRYVRFWEDGSLTMMIFNKKQSKAILLECFQQKVPGIKFQDKYLRGEYILNNDQLDFITFRQGTTFHFKLQLKTHKSIGSHPFNILLLQSSTLHMLGENYNTDLCEGKKYFYIYKHYEELRDSLGNNQSNWKHVVY